MSVVFLVLIVGSLAAHLVAAAVVLIAAFVLVAVLTGDPPGGPRSGGRPQERTHR